MSEYIEKNLWLATNFAAKMIRETGHRNKSIRIASGYYNVDEDDVSKQLSIRQSKGQKGKKRGKFYWFTYIGKMDYEQGYDGGMHFEEEVKLFGKAMSDIKFIRNKDSWNVSGRNNQYSNNSYIALYRYKEDINDNNITKIIDDDGKEYWIKGVFKKFDKKKEAEEYLKTTKRSD